MSKPVTKLLITKRIKMKTKELEKLFKDRLAKDGINKKWMDEKLIFVGLDEEETDYERF